MDNGYGMLAIFKLFCWCASDIRIRFRTSASAAQRATGTIYWTSGTSIYLSATEPPISSSLITNLQKLKKGCLMFLGRVTILISGGRGDKFSSLELYTVPSVVDWHRFDWHRFVANSDRDPTTHFDAVPPDRDPTPCYLHKFEKIWNLVLTSVNNVLPSLKCHSLGVIILSKVPLFWKHIEIFWEKGTSFLFFPLVEMDTGPDSDPAKLCRSDQIRINNTMYHCTGSCDEGDGRRPAGSRGPHLFWLAGRRSLHAVEASNIDHLYLVHPSQLCRRFWQINPFVFCPIYLLHTLENIYLVNIYFGIVLWDSLLRFFSWIIFPQASDFSSSAISILTQKKGLFIVCLDNIGQQFTFVDWFFFSLDSRT